ncbi:hypothetical protein WJ968_04375 [Achromobacter xylosoxidans]
MLAYGGYQLLPQGPALTRSEVIGELDGPPLAAHARADLYRYGERQLLVGTMSKASWDPVGLARAQVLDADEPGLQALARGQRAAMAQTGAVDGGQAQADAPDPPGPPSRPAGRAAWSTAAMAPGSSRCAPRSPPTPAPGWSARRKAARCSW